MTRNSRRAGERTRVAGRAAATLQAIASSDFRDPEGLYYLARQLAHAEAADAAITVLQRATDAGFGCYPMFASDEWLAPIRQRPDFMAVLEPVEHEHAQAQAAFTAAAGDQILGLD